MSVSMWPNLYKKLDQFQIPSKIFMLFLFKKCFNFFPHREECLLKLSCVILDSQDLDLFKANDNQAVIFEDVHFDFYI